MQPHLSNSNAGSLAEIAQRDLDAALQLLTDRAQYITGATGAAIALRRDGRNDMLCRASTGSNAPELGALLSAEYGLSGESVRTRRPLRCDDAERDARVNREVCRKLGIASVVVMPVVNDDEVLGVLELFSGKANAFGERDVSAVQRLSEMVETAVRLARATEMLPEQLKAAEKSGITAASAATETEDDILEVDVIESEPQAAAMATGAAPSLTDVASHGKVDAVPTPASEKAEGEATDKAAPAPTLLSVSSAWANPAKADAAIPEPVAAATAALSTPAVEPEHVPAAPKPLFWSAAQVADTEAETPGEADQSHVPPMLRSLKKCEVCGFPITAGRSLCVECEEKRWRGQLRRSSPLDRMPAKAVVSALKIGGTASAAAAPAKVATGTAPALAPSAVQKTSVVAPPSAGPDSATKAAVPPPSVAVQTKASAEPELVLSAGLRPEQSWFGRNKFVIIVLLGVAASAAYFLLR